MRTGMDTTNNSGLSIREIIEKFCEENLLVFENWNIGYQYLLDLASDIARYRQIDFILFASGNHQVDPGNNVMRKRIMNHDSHKKELINKLIMYNTIIS